MTMLSVRELSKSYPGFYLDKVSFSLEKGYIMGFIGRNGRGKTTFLNLLRGKYSYSGTIASSVEFEYFPFEVDDPYMTPLDIAESIQPDFEQWRLSRELNLLDVDPDDIFYRPYCTLSYGERTKVLLAIQQNVK